MVANASKMSWSIRSVGTIDPGASVIWRYPSKTTAVLDEMDARTTVVWIRYFPMANVAVSVSLKDILNMPSVGLELGFCQVVDAVILEMGPSVKPGHTFVVSVSGVPVSIKIPTAGVPSELTA